MPPADGNVDAVAIEIAAVYNDITEIDADAQDYPSGVRQTIVGLGRPYLKIDCALDGIDRAGELDQNAVAHDLNQAASISRDRGARISRRRALRTLRVPCSSASMRRL